MRERTAKGADHGTFSTVGPLLLIADHGTFFMP